MGREWRIRSVHGLPNKQKSFVAADERILFAAIASGVISKLWSLRSSCHDTILSGLGIATLRTSQVGVSKDAMLQSSTVCRSVSPMLVVGAQCP